MKCAVANCGHTNNIKGQGIRYYCFPREEPLLQQWVEFCGRKTAFNTKYARICSAHFKASDFLRNLQYEMGYTTKNAFKLKPGTIPTLTRNSVDEPFERAELASPSQENNMERIVNGATILNFEQQQFNRTETSLLHNDTARDPLEESPIYLTVAKEVKSAEDNNETRVRNLEQEVKLLKQQNFALKKSEERINMVNTLLRKQIQKMEHEGKKLEEQLQQMFTEGQVNKLKSGGKRRVWTATEIAQSKKLYSISSKAYKFLMKRNFPLPSIRTLQYYIPAEDAANPVVVEHNSTELPSELTNLL